MAPPMKMRETDPAAQSRKTKIILNFKKAAKKENCSAKDRPWQFGGLSLSCHVSYTLLQWYAGDLSRKR